MRLLLASLLLVSAAYGQIANPVTASSLGLGATDSVTFDRVATTANGSFTNPAIRIGASNTGLISVSGFLYGVSRGESVFAASPTGFTIVPPATFSTNVTVNGSLTAAENTVLSGVNNTMPNATTAASGASLMTRDLVFRAQADDNSGDLVAMVGNTTNGGTGAAAAVNNVFGATAQVSTNSNSVAGVYFADNIWGNSTVSGAVMPSGKTIDLTMKGVNFRNLTNTSYVIRVVAGAGTPFRTIPAAGQDALSAKGWGVNFFYNGTNHVFQPFWYTTNYNTGPQTVVSNATANDSIFALRLRHVGPTTNGTISFWINNGLASRLSETPSFSTNVGDWGGNFGGRHYAIESATATNAAPASTTSIRVRAAYIKYEP